MTDEQFSGMPPPLEMSQFSPDPKSKISLWLDKLQTHLEASNAANKRTEEIAWLRRAIDQAEPSLQNQG